MTTLTADALRGKFTEFASPERFPDGLLDFWLEIADSNVNGCRWGTLYDMGRMLYAAHNIVLERRAQDEAENGATPGMSTVGMVNNKSVDKVSIGYDTTSIALEGAGDWNLTIYGQRYIRMARRMGAGGLQLGVPGPTEIRLSGLSSGNAWPGPWTSNFPNPSDSG